MADYSKEHMNRILPAGQIQLDDLQPGCLIRFEYNGEKRIVYLLNPKWQNKLHALTLAPLPPHAVLRVGQVFDEGIAGVNPLNPQQFYNTYLSKQKIIVDADCYRTFSREKIEGTPQLLEYDHRQTDRLIDYDNYADYEASDADIESEGYFGDIHAIRRFPGAFKTRNELVDKIMSGEVIHMTRSELMMLENTYLRKVIQAASPKKVAMKFAQEKHKDWERIVTGLLAGDSIPPAIVIRSKTGNFLLGGNVRLSAGAAWGFNMPIKTVDI